MSTSLNVVSIANVFWESFKRLAMRFLSLGIGTCSYRCKRLQLQPNPFKTDSMQLYNFKPLRISLTRRSRSFGGSCGSVGEVFEGVGFGACFLGGSTFVGFSSAFGDFSSAFAGGDSFWGASSDGATCVSAGAADFDTIATMVPGVTVSPSLAINCGAMALRKLVILLQLR